MPDNIEYKFKILWETKMMLYISNRFTTIRKQNNANIWNLRDLKIHKTKADNIEEER